MSFSAEKAAEAEEEEFAACAQPPVAELRHVPEDRRTKARWNFFSRLLFIWLDPLLWLGWRHELKQEDLYRHPQEADAEKLLKAFHKHWAVELMRKDRGGTARLWVVIFKCLWFRILIQGILLLLEVALQVSESVVLGRLANYFTINNPTPEDTRDAYLYAAGLVLMAFVVSLLHGHGFLAGQKAGMIARVLCTTAIYQKILKLSQVTLGKVSTGHVINLASNDVQRFDQTFLFLHFLWISPLHLAVFTYLVYHEVGWPAFLAMGFIILQVPLQIFLARVFGKLRFKSAQVTDKRVRIMNEVITGIRVIKMYAWEYAFKHVVTKLRNKEYYLVLLAGVYRAVIVFQFLCGRVLVLGVIFVPFSLMGGDLTPRITFTIISLSWPLVLHGYRHVLLATLEGTEMQVASSRIQSTPADTMTPHPSMSQAKLLLFWADFLRAPLMEVVHVLKQKAIQAALTTYTFVLVARLPTFLIFVPSVLTGNEESLSAYFFVLSLVHVLSYASYTLMRCFINSFDSYTSLQRIQSTPADTMTPHPSMSQAKLLLFWADFLRAPLMEVVQVLKQKAIQAAMTTYSFVLVTPLTMFLIFVPSVLTGGVQFLSAYFVVLSLAQILRRMTITLLNSFVSSFDTFTSLQRIQAKLLLFWADFLGVPLMEVVEIFKQKAIQASVTGFSFIAVVPIMLFLVFVPNAFAGNVQSLSAYFIVLSLIQRQRVMTIFLLRCFITSFDAYTSLQRIQNLLELEELKSAPPSSPSYSVAPVVRLDGVALSWSEDGDKRVLSGVSFTVNEERPLLAIVGPVGAGKSTLLQCLLGELQPVEGTVKVKGQVSYASQEAWVFSGTLRDNILLGKTFEHDHYQSVLEACALDKDAAQLLHGDLTLVGERGVTLSGGQKARVNLARAVYHHADLYILDDPLSAVDTAVARQLYDKVVCGLLKGRRVVLVTHQLQFAQLADNILAIKDGRVEAYGSHKELLASGVELLQLMKTEGEDDERDIFSYHEEEEGEGGEGEGSADVRRESVGVIEDGETHPLVPSPVLSYPQSPRMRKNIIYFDGSESSNLNKPSVCYLGDNLKQFPPDSASIYSAPSMLSIHSAAEAESSRHDEEQLYGPPPEEKGHGTISLATYYRYFRAGGSYLLLGAVVIVFLLGEASVVLSDWWLADWAGCTSKNLTLLDKTNKSVHLLCKLNVDQRVGIYGGAVLGVIVVNLTRTIAFFFVCVNASRILHNEMFASILRAPVLFFDTNPIGRVLNRFSKDVGFLDDLLPFQFCEYMLLLLRFIAIIITAIVSNPWVLIPASVIIVLFVVMRTYYLKTSREIKRLEAVARSPLYSHISTTLQGLPTIRSFHQESAALQYLYRVQDEHTQGWYLYLVSTRWFGMRIDFVSGLFLAAVAFSSLPLASSLNAGLVGLGLTYAVSLAGMFQYCVRLSAEVENVMISAERVMAYSKLDPEASLETLFPHKPPPTDWPTKGALSLADVAFRYSDNLPLVLKNLSFSINPSEKVGIVGRTGAGKSSVISVLFRLAEPFGQVQIDGIDSKEIGLHDLRRRISIIPQDPVLFSGTVRYNLDPFDEYTDHRLWTVLEQVQLKAVVEELEGGLQAVVTEGGTNFSVGQKQLVCLARALLRSNKILVLDEATANVDIKTDSIIQDTLRELFVDCTVLTIAHRLNTIMDSDRILVMNKGQVKEFDQPYRLLQQPRSLFRRMVDQTGEMAARKLYKMAQDAYMHRRVSRRDSRL